MFLILFYDHTIFRHFSFSFDKPIIAFSNRFVDFFSTLGFTMLLELH